MCNSFWTIGAIVFRHAVNQHMGQIRFVLNTHTSQEIMSIINEECLVLLPSGEKEVHSEHHHFHLLAHTLIHSHCLGFVCSVDYVDAAQDVSVELGCPDLKFKGLTPTAELSFSSLPRCHNLTLVKETPPSPSCRKTPPQHFTMADILGCSH